MSTSNAERAGNHHRIDHARGSHEEFVPVRFVDAYVLAATRAGDQVRRILIPGAGHFEIANPLSFPWPEVRAAIGSLLDGKLPS